MKTDYFRIGKISTTHGLEGNLKVHPTMDDPREILHIESLFFQTKEGYEEKLLDSIRLQKNEIVIKLHGIDDIETARRLIGTEVYIKREQYVELSKDEYYIPDLIGLQVLTDEGKFLGIINDVIATGANDVYSVKREEGTDVLIPAIHECILSVDIEEGTMKVHLLPGLL